MASVYAHAYAIALTKAGSTARALEEWTAQNKLVIIKTYFKNLLSKQSDSNLLKSGKNCRWSKVSKQIGAQAPVIGLSKDSSVETV